MKEKQINNTRTKKHNKKTIMKQKKHIRTHYDKKITKKQRRA